MERGRQPNRVYSPAPLTPARPQLVNNVFDRAAITCTGEEVRAPRILAALLAVTAVLTAPAVATADNSPGPGSPSVTPTTPAPDPTPTPEEPTPTPSPSEPAPTPNPTPTSPEPRPPHTDGQGFNDIFPDVTPEPPSTGGRPLPGSWPIPDLNFGTDPKLIAAAKARLREVRAELAAAENDLVTAQAAQAQAEQRAKDAEWDALMAEIRAEQAREVLQRHASDVYRSGGGVPSLVRIVDGSLENPANVLDEQAYLSQATLQRAAEVDRARQIVAEAAQYAATAQAARAAADAALEAAVTTEEELTRKLERARRELTQVMTLPAGVQTLIGPNGCPTQVPDGTMRGSAASVDPYDLCRKSVRAAATPEAALAIKYLFRALGAPYACEGVGRTEPYRYDCSSLAARAYAEGAGLATAGPGWSPSTRDMVPWDGVSLSPWYGLVQPQDARPGDLFLYDTGGATYRHVVIMIADGFMIHTNSCGDVAKVEEFWGPGVGGASFLVARRVLPDKARTAQSGT